MVDEAENTKMLSKSTFKLQSKVWNSILRITKSVLEELRKWLSFVSFETYYRIYEICVKF